MIKAIIIDDEAHCIDRLAMLLKKDHRHEIQIIASFDNVQEGIKGIKELNPDVVFLDVQIGNKTGFDVLKQLDEKNFEVVFTTAFDKYAVQAFKFSAVDYLLKPVDADDLRHAVEKLKEKKDKEQLSSKMDALFHNIKSIRSASKKIVVPSVNGLNFLDVADIIRCESDINYTTIFLKDKQKITVSKTLKDFEELLSPFNFFRIHNSHLINLAYIKSYNRGKGGSVTMTDHSELEVSTRRKDDFLKRLAEL